MRIELTKEGSTVNTKKVHRLWRDEELQVRPRKRKRCRGTSTIDEVIACRPNQVGHWTAAFLAREPGSGRVR